MSTLTEVISELQTANKCQYESHMSEILTISTVTHCCLYTIKKGKDDVSMCLASQFNLKKERFWPFSFFVLA